VDDQEEGMTTWIGSKSRLDVSPACGLALAKLVGERQATSGDSYDQSGLFCL
jgi:hypothetical protein